MSKKTIVLCGMIMLLSSYAWAADPATPEPGAGIKSNYSKVFVQNLPIGQTVSMKELVNLPLIISHHYNTPVFISIVAEKPEKPKEGFEAIPDPNWIQVESNGLTLEAQSEVKLDVKVSVPNDESLLGRKFQVFINVFTPGETFGGAIRYGYQIKGNFLFTIAPVRNEEGLKAALEHPSDAAFTLFPPRVNLFNVLPGMTVKAISPERKKITITNNSNKRQKYFLASIDPFKTAYAPDPGAQFTGDPDQVDLGQDEISLNPGQSKQLDIKIKVPKGMDFTQNPLVYLVSVKSGHVQGMEKFIEIYLWNREIFKSNTEPQVVPIREKK